MHSAPAMLIFLQRCWALSYLGVFAPDNLSPECFPMRRDCIQNSHLYPKCFADMDVFHLQISAQSSPFQKSLLWLFMQRNNPLPHHPIVFTMFLPLALMIIFTERCLLVFLLYIFLHWNYYTSQKARNFICSLLVDWLIDWLIESAVWSWQIIRLPCS